MPAGTEIRVDLLGPLRLRVGAAEVAAGPPRQRALLGFLAASVGRTVSRDDLVDAVWGEAPPASAPRNAQTYVSGLRRLLREHAAPAVLVTAGTGYRLELPDSAVDTRRAQLLLDDAAALVRAGRGGESVGTWRSALRLWQGTPFADVAAPYVAAERGRLTALRLTGVEGLASALLAAGRAEEAAAVLAEATAEHPLHERLIELTMRAFQQLGRTGDALALYTRTSTALADRLGLDLTPGLRALHAELLADRGRATPAERHPGLPKRGGFRGRAAELAGLTARLDAHRDAGRPLIFAVDGPPGVGKTAFAVELAHRVRDRFPDGAHFLNLRGHRPDRDPMTPEQALRQLLGALGVDAGDRAQDEQAAAYRSALAGKRALVVLDDAIRVEQVRPLLPGTGGSLVLVTSRIRLAGLAARDGAVRVPLSPLPDEDARHLLADVLDADPAVLAELAALCGNLPLALTLTAARAQADPAGLVAELRTHRERLLGDEDGLRAVFSWSLAGLSARARELFALLGLHPGGAVTPPVAGALLDVPVPVARKLLDELATASLLDWGRKRTYRAHDLVRLYSTDLATGLPPGARAAAEDRLFRFALHTARAAHRRAFPLRGLPGERFPAALEHAPVPPLAFADEREALAWYEAERESLADLVRRAAARGRDDVAAWLPLVLADFLRGTREAPQIFRLSAAAARRAADHRAHALATLYLGDSMFPDGASRRAAVSLQEAFTLASTGPGHDRAETAYVLGLAAPPGSLRSVRLLTSAAKIYAERDDREGRASALLALGSTQAKRGNVAAAIDSLRAALTLVDGDRAEMTRRQLDTMNSTQP
ncbi:AfsR/SARP family transcriptional regulator, partial [Actinokineospora bangkokensis]